MKITDNNPNGWRSKQAEMFTHTQMRHWDRTNSNGTWRNLYTYIQDNEVIN